MAVDDAGRVATLSRVTKETNVQLSIGLDGTGKCSSATGIPFLDHMMDVRITQPFMPVGNISADTTRGPQAGASPAPHGVGSITQPESQNAKPILRRC